MPGLLLNTAYIASNKSDSSFSDKLARAGARVITAFD